MEGDDGADDGDDQDIVEGDNGGVDDDDRDAVEGDDAADDGDDRDAVEDEEFEVSNRTRSDSMSTVTRSTMP